MTLTQGGIYLTKLNPAKGAEISKLRPAVVLTNQLILQAKPPIVMICPLSSQSYSEFNHLHLELAPRDNLKVVSYALVEHCRSISISRFTGNRIAHLHPTEMTELLRRFKLLISYSN